MITYLKDYEGTINYNLENCSQPWCRMKYLGKWENMGCDWKEHRILLILLPDSKLMSDQVFGSTEIRSFGSKQIAKLEHYGFLHLMGHQNDESRGFLCKRLPFVHACDILMLIEQRCPASWPWPTTGLWPIWNWAVHIVGECMQLHLPEWWMRVPIACTNNCAHLHLCLPLGQNHPLSLPSLDHQAGKAWDHCRKSAELPHIPSCVQVTSGDRSDSGSSELKHGSLLLCLNL